MTERAFPPFLVIGTPIGNLGDLSPRAREALCSCEVLFAEDTRVSRKLCAYVGCHPRLERADENVAAARAKDVVDLVRSGRCVGFVSDAGMPALSDPGSVLVDAVLDAGLSVEVIPGPSALTTAVAASGLRATHIMFEGFLPRKKGACAARLQTLSELVAACVFFESPHRVMQTLEAIAEAFGTRRLALCRELTKVHEEILRGSAKELLGTLQSREEPLKGECVIVVEEPYQTREEPTTHPDVTQVCRVLLDLKLPAAKTAKALSKICGIGRDEAYELVQNQGRR